MFVGSIKMSKSKVSEICKHSIIKKSELKSDNQTTNIYYLSFTKHCYGLIYGNIKLSPGLRNGELVTEGGLRTEKL